mmetsp:Transcript_75684/g.175497  ORF Transcript_75684/g.175497 Transcript_75684/m.175497 type:complete len:238 (+) Transcript_75684:884-1597(+)
MMFTMARLLLARLKLLWICSMEPWLSATLATRTSNVRRKESSSWPILCSSSSTPSSSRSRGSRKRNQGTWFMVARTTNVVDTHHIAMTKHPQSWIPTCFHACSFCFSPTAKNTPMGPGSPSASLQSHGSAKKPMAIVPKSPPPKCTGTAETTSSRRAHSNHHFIAMAVTLPQQPIRKEMPLPNHLQPAVTAASPESVPMARPSARILCRGMASMMAKAQQAPPSAPMVVLTTMRPMT